MSSRQGTNNGGGARWHLMAWGVCPRCGLRHRIGIEQEAGRKSMECRHRARCDARKAKREGCQPSKFT
jgi:hypothetical protein